MLSSEQRLQRNESLKQASQETMSYSYGPTVVYPPTFSMGEPFSNAFEHKENYSFGMNIGLSKVSAARCILFGVLDCNEQHLISVLDAGLLPEQSAGLLKLEQCWVLRSKHLLNK